MADLETQQRNGELLTDCRRIADQIGQRMAAQAGEKGLDRLCQYSLEPAYRQQLAQGRTTIHQLHITFQ